MAKDHHVTKVRQQVQLSDTDSGFRPVFHVHYEVTDGPAAGTTGHVVIPADQYNAATVRDTVAQMVQDHQEVHSI